MTAATVLFEDGFPVGSAQLIRRACAAPADCHKREGGNRASHAEWSFHHRTLLKDASQEQISTKPLVRAVLEMVLDLLDEQAPGFVLARPGGLLDRDLEIAKLGLDLLP